MKITDLFLQILAEQENRNISLNGIEEAIDDRVSVIIYYEGDEKIKPGYRLINPFVLGQGFKMKDKIYNTDKYYLRSFVLKDLSSVDAIKIIRKKNIVSNLPSQSVSKTKKDPYWRLFRVDKITYWFPVYGMPEFKIKPLYNPNDKNLVNIIKNV